MDRRRDRAIMDALETVRMTMADSLDLTDRTVRVFRGNQRAIGEVLLVPAPEFDRHPGPRWDCLGYAAFTIALHEGAELARWFGPLLDSVDIMARKLGRHPTGLALTQHRLMDLFSVLDPTGSRVPANQRRLLPLTESRPLIHIGEPSDGRERPESDGGRSRH
jgi:hypothetical protein